MRTLVLVKHVPDPDIPPPYTAELTIDRSAGEGTMSGVDVFAVGEAVRLADGGSCVVATVGPAASEATLRQAITLGATEAIHVSDERLAGADMHATARVLAAVVGRENPGVVVLGREATDSRMGVLPALLAELLRWPVLSAVEGLRADGNGVRARRRDDRGVVELRTKLPAVVSAAEYANEPASATLADLRRAQTAVIRRMDLADLGLVPTDWPAPAMTVTTLRETPPLRQTRLVTENVVDEVLEALRRHGVTTVATAREPVSA